MNALPDPAVQVLDPSFEKYRLLLASVERLSQGYSWAEGPVYFADTRCLLWSDIPNNRIMRWDEETGATTIFRKPSNYANGNTRDRQGRLVTAEHGRRVTRTEYDGKITVLIDKFEGKRLSSPNDIVVKSDDSIWFTDMTAGIDGNWNGETGEQELPQRVYRIDGKTGKPTVVSDGLIKRPNGLAFSPDEKKLYVIESQPQRARDLCVRRHRRHARQRQEADHLRKDRDAGRLPRRQGRQSVVRLGHDAGDGRRARVQSAGQADRAHSLPERCANVCFGGPKRNRLFMTASHSLYALYVNTQGATLGG